VSPLLKICLRCREHLELYHGGCSGPCKCLLDGKDVFQHVDAAQCPADKYADTPPDHGGPGTELSRLLSTIGIHELPDCQCKSKAAAMDARGCDWCEANIDKIVEWLRQEAERQGAGGMFVAFAAKSLVRRAIAKARKSQVNSFHVSNRNPG